MFIELQINLAMNQFNKCVKLLSEYDLFAFEMRCSHIHIKLSSNKIFMHQHKN